MLSKDCMGHGMGVGKRGRWRQQEEGREWEVNLACEMRNDSFEKIN